jgi:hypothetical protein
MDSEEPVVYQEPRLPLETSGRSALMTKEPANHNKSNTANS